MDEGGVPLEVVIMQGVSHPNIVQLLDYKLQLKDSGCQPRLWLVLEYCHGGTLAVRAHLLSLRVVRLLLFSDVSACSILYSVRMGFSLVRQLHLSHPQLALLADEAAAEN